MTHHKKSKKSKEELSEQKRIMQENADKEQSLIWFEEDTLKRFLKFAATFHQYSYNNQLLIHARFPNASMVATYGGWIKKGRKVKVTENKNYIELFAPNPKTAWVEKDVLDDNGNIVYDQNGNKKTEAKRINYMDYRVVYVYEASQTDGEALPALAGESEDPLFETKEDLYCALKNASNDISDSMSPCDMLRCVSRQFLLQLSPDVNDVEIEACSYVLSSYLQIDGESCNTNAIFDWAKGKDGKEIAATMSRVQKTCRKIIGGLEESECSR